MSDHLEKLHSDSVVGLYEDNSRFVKIHNLTGLIRKDKGRRLL